MIEVIYATAALIGAFGGCIVVPMYLNKGVKEDVDEVRNNFLGSVSRVENTLDGISNCVKGLNESLHKTQIDIVKEVGTLSERISKIEVILNEKK